MVLAGARTGEDAIVLLGWKFGIGNSELFERKVFWLRTKATLEAYVDNKGIERMAGLDPSAPPLGIARLRGDPSERGSGIAGLRLIPKE